MHNNVIIKALNALYEDVNKSKLDDSKKNTLNELIDILITYYKDRLNIIYESKNDIKINNKISDLETEITDYIVAICDNVNNEMDTSSVIDMIYKEINYDINSHQFKRKRLI